MRRKALLIVVSFLISQALTVQAQFTSEELAQRQEIEEFLKNAEIVNFEEIGEGVTRPLRLYLKLEDKECRGVWKNPQGIQLGSLEGWEYEIAAYEMDKLLALNMIPPTVEREFNGKRGSLQHWVDSPLSDLDRMEKGIQIPQDKLELWTKRKYLVRAFDCLIANDDRTQQNIRYTEDWRTILIDHSRSFRSTREYTERLVYGKNGIKGTFLFRQLPRNFTERVKALNFETVKKAIGPYLTDEEIKSIIKRRDLFLKEIAEMIKEKGEDKVLY